ncbi:MAG: LysR family transcriptional regulator [Collimonas pratensis]|uniref:LysR family transcriptional regulator n=1 Tax=Collimonas pratensis TaxID=279113 RepID=UPI003C76BA6D
MELRHLRYFVVVAEERNFTRAARRLNMQQPPLSQQIRALEQELGFALFHRHPKGVDLSIGGEAFLHEAQTILANVTQAAQRAARAANGIEGIISVGLTSSAAAHPLTPRILQAYRKARPAVVMKFSEANAAELTAAIASGKLDAGFLRMPVSQPPGLAFQRLVDEEMLLVLPSGHALLKKSVAKAMPVISLTSLRDEQFILVRKPGASGMYANFVEACVQAGFTPDIAVEVDGMLTNICLVAAGVGISVVPTSMHGFHSDQVRYCRILESSAKLRAPLTLVCQAAARLPAVQQFLAEASRFAELDK